MRPFELRLAEQHSRNSRHLKNLRAFIDDPSRFNLLDPEDRTLIIEQCRLMGELDTVLEARLTRLNIPV